MLKGSALQKHREEKALQSQQLAEQARRQEAHTAENMAQLRAIIANPGASEQEKARAREDLDLAMRTGRG